MLNYFAYILHLILNCLEFLNIYLLVRKNLVSHILVPIGVKRYIHFIIYRSYSIIRRPIIDRRSSLECSSLQKFKYLVDLHFSFSFGFFVIWFLDFFNYWVLKWIIETNFLNFFWSLYRIKLNLIFQWPFRNSFIRKVSFFTICNWSFFLGRFSRIR